MFKKILLGVLLVCCISFSRNVNESTNSYWYNEIMYRYVDGLKVAKGTSHFSILIKKENNQSCWFEQYDKDGTHSKHLYKFDVNKLIYLHSTKYDSSGNVIQNLGKTEWIYIVPGSVGEIQKQLCRESKVSDYVSKIDKFKSQFYFEYNEIVENDKKLYFVVYEQGIYRADSLFHYNSK